MAAAQLASDKVPGQNLGGFRFVKLDKQWLTAVRKLPQADLMQLQMEKMYGDGPRFLTTFEAGKSIPGEVEDNLRDLYQFSPENLKTLKGIEGKHRIIAELKSGDQVTDVANEIRSLFEINPSAVVVFKHTSHPELVIVQKDGDKIKVTRE